MEYIQAMYSTITLSATFRLSAPLLLGLAGYCFSNKAGIMNIALESFMMISAFFALLGSYLFHSAFIGALFGVVAGTVLSFLYGVLVFHAGANGLITGVGFNLSGWGLTTMLLVAIFHTRGATNVGAVSFSPIDVPILRDIPYLGKIFNQQTILVYLGPLLMLIAWVVMYKTPFGVRIRAVGLNRRAAETAGVSVMKYSWIAMLLSGACMGLSGTFISLNSLAMFSENMTGGRGFMVLASAMVAGGNPLKAMLCGFIFAYCDALTLTWSGFDVYSQVISMLPYLAVLLVLFLTHLKNIKSFGRFEAS
ncbi:ABC transporter permease [Anaerofilum sp. BX8]|uniref:ABC transporter permease n=1 Tax=Anaerofilum hominis TaxID=2763016 RepID=A0A923I6H1_9FIRM|nr:ABC transporter permease [Anaerofilum hominis]MBC5580034.1 ABC transporter permease [Anaerofilum hominis]